MALHSTEPPVRIRHRAGALFFLLALFFALVALMYSLTYREDNRFFRELAGVVLEDVPEMNSMEACMKLLDFSSGIPPLTGSPPIWVRLAYRFGPFKPDPRTVLRYGTDPRGPCGSRSRVLAALLEARDVPVRLTSLHHDGRAVHTEVEAVSGQTGVPVLVDPDHGVEGMPESDDIVAYLEETYGDGASA